MRRRHSSLGSSLVSLAMAVTLGSVLLPTTAAATQGAEPASAGLPHCTAPAPGAGSTQTSPASAGLDPAKFAEAMHFAESRLRLNVQVHRNNCLVGAAPLNPATKDVPWNLMSSTKSVVAMLAGVAVKQDKLSVNAPIGRYLPAGLGDAAHRAITVRDLLTQTSGLKVSTLSEALPGFAGVDVNIVREALATPIEHKPGTYFEYSQYDTNLLAYVIQRAVGQDLQRFAQQELFGPIGIGAHDYFWLRDRSGNTYGFANLYLPAKDFARLGLLMENGGAWNGRRLINPDYVHSAAAPTTTNPCYGYLFWTNHKPCIGPSLPSRQVFNTAPLPGMPSDAYAMVGFLQQNNFIAPSLGLVVTWTGAFGDVSADPQTLISASPHSELYHKFLRLLSQAFVHPRLPDPGPYKPSFNLELKPQQVLDPAMLAGGIGLGPDAPPGCNVLLCTDTPLPHKGTTQNVGAILDAVTHH